MQDGWIKVWRKVQDNAIFGDDALFKCWIYCLMQATHKEYELLINGQIVKLMPGQFISGRNKANKVLKWKGKKFDRKMIFLEKHQYLTREVTNSYTKNTIINWDIYQLKDNEGDQLSDQGVTNPRPTPDQGVTTYKNVKNVKNDKNKESIYHTDTKPFLSFYKEQFKANFSTEPIIEWGRDGAIIKNLLKEIPLENLKLLLDSFFSSEDAFIRGSGYTIPIFKSQINKLKVSGINKEVPKHLKGLKKVWEGLRDGKEAIPLLNDKVS